MSKEDLEAFADRKCHICGIGEEDDEENPLVPFLCYQCNKTVCEKDSSYCAECDEVWCVVCSADEKREMYDAEKCMPCHKQREEEQLNSRK